MKRILFVALVATTFFVVPIVNANEDFHGTYDMAATGICLHSTSGWTKATAEVDGFNGWKPTAPIGDVWAGTATTIGTWVFKSNGTGTFRGTNYGAIFPGASKTTYEYKSGTGFDFTYEVTNGAIVTVNHPSGLVMNGMLTLDKQVMTLVSASYPQNLTSYGLGYLVMDAVRILIKVKD